MCSTLQFSTTFTCQRVVEYVVLLQKAPARVEDTNSSFFSVVDLISSQRGIRVCLDPDASQGVAVDVVFNQESLARVVDKNAAIFTTKDLVSSDDRITASSVKGQRSITYTPS